MQEVIVHTGQHFDANMSDIFFDQLAIPRPHHQLDIHGGSHGDMTGRMLIEIEKVLLQERPDCVLVYGDTNSTLAGALAAAGAAGGATTTSAALAEGKILEKILEKKPMFAPGGGVEK